MTSHSPYARLRLSFDPSNDDADVAELADAVDSKSTGDHTSWEFDPPHRHQNMSIPAPRIKTRPRKTHAITGLPKGIRKRGDVFQVSVT